jgi:hypothetical protein
MLAFYLIISISKWMNYECSTGLELFVALSGPVKKCTAERTINII